MTYLRIDLKTVSVNLGPGFEARPVLVAVNCWSTL